MLGKIGSKFVEMLQEVATKKGVGIDQERKFKKKIQENHEVRKATKQYQALLDASLLPSGLKTDQLQQWLEEKDTLTLIVNFMKMQGGNLIVSHYYHTFKERSYDRAGATTPQQKQAVDSYTEGLIGYIQYLLWENVDDNQKFIYAAMKLDGEKRYQNIMRELETNQQGVAQIPTGAGVTQIVAYNNSFA